MLTANLLHAHFAPSAWGPASETFDPYRFLALNKSESQTSSQSRRWGITSTSPDILTFGHGKYSCPGRWFAALEMKLMMACLIYHYDAKLDLKDAEEKRRPENMWFGLSCMPNTKQRVLLKKRKVST